MAFIDHRSVTDPEATLKLALDLLDAFGASPIKIEVDGTNHVWATFPHGDRVAFGGFTSGYSGI